jgi:hypothetical protein
MRSVDERIFVVWIAQLPDRRDPVWKRYDIVLSRGPWSIVLGRPEAGIRRMIWTVNLNRRMTGYARTNDQRDRISASHFSKPQKSPLAD